MLLIDENFDQRILRGLRLRLPQLDYLIVQDIGLGGLDDPALLDWAGKGGRVIVTHDVNSMTGFGAIANLSGLKERLSRTSFLGVATLYQGSIKACSFAEPLRVKVGESTYAHGG